MKLAPLATILAHLYIVRLSWRSLISCSEIRDVGTVGGWLRRARKFIGVRSARQLLHHANVLDAREEFSRRRCRLVARALARSVRKHDA